MEKRCYKCMEPLSDGDVCPACGFKASADAEGMSLSFIKSRYCVGDVFSKTLDSTVYVAYDEALDKKVFLREFTGEGIAKISNKYTASELRQKFLNYAKGTATLNMCELLPHTVDAFEENDVCYLVTDHFEGESLKTLLRSGIKISESNALKITKKLLNGLEAIHSSGLIFGAISPETLYLLKNGEVRVFGLASRFYDFTDELDCRVELLNPSYSAPELFEENSKIGAFCDVYSAAAILYRILTDEIPAIGFLRSGGENLVSPKKINKNIPKSISVALLNALNWQIESRTATAGELLKELSAKKVKRVLSPAIVWAGILGIFQKGYEKPQRDGEKGDKKSLLWLWITVPAIILLILVLLLFLFLPKTSDTGSNSSNNSTSIEDGWYYGSGIETPVSSNDYVYGGADEDDASSRSSSPSTSQSNFSSDLQNNSDYVNYPGFVGYTLEQAKKQIEKSGCFVGKIVYNSSDDHYSGYVIGESIKPNSYVKKGTVINLIVCKNEENASIPDLSGRGLTMQQAEKELKNAGFTSISYEFVSDSAAPGTALSARFKNDSEQTLSGEVIIVVSGEAISPIADFKGKTAAGIAGNYPDVSFIFKDANGNEISKTDVESGAYTVYDQDLPAGHPAYKGISVTLWIS